MPRDAFKPPRRSCRAAAGACEPRESCTGSSAACPADAKSSDGHVARPRRLRRRRRAATARTRLPRRHVQACLDPVSRRGGACDLAESCTRLRRRLPCRHERAPAVCRAAAGDCDVAESCGRPPQRLPHRYFKPSTTQCRLRRRRVTMHPDRLHRLERQLPRDGESTAVCRPAADVVRRRRELLRRPQRLPHRCLQARDDAVSRCCRHVRPAESCTGPAPAARPMESTAVCRAAAGDCDGRGSCDGISNDCPADASKPPRPSAVPPPARATSPRGSPGRPPAAPPTRRAPAVCPARRRRVRRRRELRRHAQRLSPPTPSSATTQCRGRRRVCEPTSRAAPAPAPPVLRTRAARPLPRCRERSIRTERCDGISTSVPRRHGPGRRNAVPRCPTGCRARRRLRAGAVQQRYQSSCGCDLDVTKAGCVVPSNRRGLRRSGEPHVASVHAPGLPATHRSQAAGKSPAPTSRVDRDRPHPWSPPPPDVKIYADVAGVPVGGTVTAPAAKRARRRRDETRVQDLQRTTRCCRRSSSDSSCAQR